MKQHYQCEHLNKELKKALEYLGKSWVLHKDYRASEHPQHSTIGKLKEGK